MPVYKLKQPETIAPTADEAKAPEPAFWMPTTPAECTALFELASKAEAMAKKTKAMCKAYAETCDTPIINAKDQEWQQVPMSTEQRCTLKLDELLALLVRAGASTFAIKSAEAMLIEVGVGSVKVGKRWEWV